MVTLENQRKNVHFHGHGIHQRDQMAAAHRNHRGYIKPATVLRGHAPEIHGEQTRGGEYCGYGAWRSVYYLCHRIGTRGHGASTPRGLVRQNLCRSHHSVWPLPDRIGVTTGAGSPEWINIEITGCFRDVQGYIAMVHPP